MHLPDGIIPFSQAIIYWIISIFFIFYFIKIMKDEENSKRLVYIAIFSAVVTVCSGISVPTPFGLPVHFFLIPLAVLILGPYSGVVVTFIALTIQALFLGMGGILSLGANIFVMGVVLSFVTYFFYNLLGDMINKSLAIFISTLSGIIFASVGQMAMIMISGAGNFELLLITLIPFYIVVGLIEGFANTVIMKFIEKLEPEMLCLNKI